MEYYLEIKRNKVLCALPPRSMPTSFFPDRCASLKL